MPTYAYLCTNCGYQFDAVQSFTDSALTACPKCGGKLRKRYGSVGVTFSGSGFFRNDSRAGVGAEKKSSASSTSGAPTETTPAKAAPPASS